MAINQQNGKIINSSVYVARKI